MLRALGNRLLFVFSVWVCDSQHSSGVVFVVGEADLRLGLVPVHVHLRWFHALVEDGHEIRVCITDARGLAPVVKGSLGMEAGVLAGAVGRCQHRQVVSFLLASFEEKKEQQPSDQHHADAHANKRACDLAAVAPECIFMVRWSSCWLASCCIERTRGRRHNGHRLDYACVDRGDRY